MPLPTPRKDEERRQDFLDRCMDNDEIKQDFGEGSDHAFAVCQQRWEDAQENSESLHQAYVAALQGDPSVNAEPDQEELDRVWSEYQDTVNMTASELEEWSNDECSKKASLSRSPIERNLRLLRKSKSDWTAGDVEDAKKTISFVSRMKEVEAGEPAEEGCPSKRTISLKNWAFDPDKGSRNRKHGDDEMSGNRYYSAFQAEPDDGKIRRENLNGKEHVVVPVVMFTEAVRQAANADEASFAPFEEFARFTASWNGRPVMRGHPQVGGQFVSAGEPSVWDSDERLGFVFNTHADDRKLKAEAFLDPDLASDEIERAENGERMEISIGVFHDLIEQPGTFQGEDYQFVQVGHTPDHLAILPADAKGACPWEEGCGAPRANQDSTYRPLTPTSATSSLDTEGNRMSETDKPDPSPLTEALRQFVAASKGDGDIPTVAAEHGNLTFGEIKRSLEQALDERGSPHFVIDATMDMVIYERMGDEDDPVRTFRESYSVDGEGNFTLGGDAVEVVSRVEYVPVDGNGNGTEAEPEASQEDVQMKVNEVIECPCNGFTEDDREKLEAFSEQDLEKLRVDPSQHPEANKAPDAKTPEDFVSQAPSEIQEVLNEGLQQRKNERSRLIQTITANSGSFTEEELQGKSTEDLRKIGELAAPAADSTEPNVDFTANAGAAPDVNVDEEEGLRPPSTHRKKASE